MSATPPNPYRAIWIALTPAAFVFLWSTGFLGSKLGLPYADPMTFMAIRYALTTVLMLGLVLAVRAPWPGSARETAHIAIAGLLLHATYVGGIFGAVVHGVSAGVIALIAGMQPLLTAAVVGPFLGERVSAMRWFGLALGFSGVGLVVWEKLGIGEATPLGFGFAILCLFGVTAGTLYQKRFCVDMDLRTGLTIQQAASLVVSIVGALLFEEMHVQWTGEFLFATFWIGVVVVIGAFSLLSLLLRRGEAVRVTSLFYLTPPTTAVLGYFMFGETLGILALAGMAVAVAGVALANR